jgi:hypothetical protein
MQLMSVATHRFITFQIAIDRFAAEETRNYVMKPGHYEGRFSRKVIFPVNFYHIIHK